ncbi:ATP-binding cassette domain-containing protein [Antarctobacter heliothermus]|uniref:ABC-type glutathione transport system ATPase component, contains duplicated ATPase domain n=1 Tax=Antarctobacter heliothermus TaxID=74033 RepID=A0A239F419_9RHOB|nr:ATP-binding cassette domain-containing protein [Antarctobacter heliothermus]SNS51461.1 ABC-type glutathione transport system ATPase component, contains duplicated ATPase domain [Antarctobacter heliothermus]
MPPSADAVAQVTDLRHRYGDTKALDGNNLELQPGRMLGLIGPDGVGKSTLLGLLAGARKMQVGTVTVLGGSMADKAHRESVFHRIAYMPQGLGKNLYQELSVFENLDFFGRLFGHDGPERRRRIDRLTRATGLDPFLNRPAGKLSGGMKQKLGLCCALIHNPDFLILDEPTTGVDPLSRGQFWDLIDEIRAERPGMSVLVSTAYMEEAERFDWLAAMDAGRVLATGTPAELRTQTGKDNLEAAFVSLLPPDKQRIGGPLVIPPRDSQPGGPAIVAKGLTRRFGDFTAVNDVSFEIELGEIFGFLGSNGCGKTTTMKMLTGLLPASEGEAWLFGKEADANNIETRKRVGFMSQNFSLWGELTVRQNLALHARLFHMPSDTIGPRIATLLKDFDLGPHAEAFAGDLPLGLKQRLSLACAVIHSPDMLILDEPTSGVDPVARDDFWDLLAQLRERMRAGEVALAIEIPAGFGRAVTSGQPVSVAAWIDGSDTSRAATIEGYVQGAHGAFLTDRMTREGQAAGAALVNIEPRYRYNPTFASLPPMAPSVPAILLMLFPAILMAVSISREREIGTITNFYVTPTGKLEFLLGKQLPYVGIGLANWLILTAMAVFLFGVPLQGSATALALGAIAYVFASTGFGLIIAVFTKSQVAAVFATTIIAMMPTVQFSGLTQPVETLEGAARVMAAMWPTNYFMQMSVGAFNKGLTFAELWPNILSISAFMPVFVGIAVLLLKKQEV